MLSYANLLVRLKFSTIFLCSHICRHLMENDFPSRSDLSHNNHSSYALIVYGIYHTRDHQTLHGVLQYLNSPGYTDFRNHAEMF